MSENVKKKKTFKEILFIVVVAALLLSTAAMVFRYAFVDVINYERAIPEAWYDYEDSFIYCRNVVGFGIFMSDVDGQVCMIRFLKKPLADRIREDIRRELEYVTNNYGDLFYSYREDGEGFSVFTSVKLNMWDESLFGGTPLVEKGEHVNWSVWQDDMNERVRLYGLLTGDSLRFLI